MKNGILLIDKPQGPTSHDVVKKLRYILNTKSVGHAGTLDPLATGLLVLLVGEATKISDLILNGDKSYEVKVKLGVETDSWDITGEVLKESPVALSEAQIRSAIDGLSGEQMLPVPAFSAVRHEGKKLYQLARKDHSIETPQRKMNFYNVEILEVSPAAVRVRFNCGKGGFVRSWAQQLGQNLGCGATVEELRRTGSAPFSVERAVSLAEVEKVGFNGDHFIPQGQALPHVKGVTIRGREERLMGHGQIPNDLAKRLIYEQKRANLEERDIPVKVMSGDSGDLLALLLAQPCRGLKIKRIFKNL